MNKAPILIHLLRSLICLVVAAPSGFSSEDSKFISELFKDGTLVYSDDFNGELNREFWGQPKGKTIEDGKLIVAPLFKSKEVAMKALKRDHHLGLEPSHTSTEFLRSLSCTYAISLKSPT